MATHTDNTKWVDKKRRSIVKTISWRTVGTIDTILISWVVIGDINFAVTIGGVELFTKMALYFLHERAWNKSNFGRVKQTPIEYEI
jgi:uncharacterized membrane protein